MPGACSRVATVVKMCINTESYAYYMFPSLSQLRFVDSVSLQSHTHNICVKTQIHIPTNSKIKQHNIRTCTCVTHEKPCFLRYCLFTGYTGMQVTQSFKSYFLELECYNHNSMIITFLGILIPVGLMKCGDHNIVEYMHQGFLGTWNQ